MEPQRWLRPARAEELPALRAAALADNHEIIAPTHVFEKRGEIVGYASLGSVPLVLPWFHTKKCKAADTLYLINQLENLSANSGQKLVCVPFAEGSPLEPFIERLGYVRGGKFNLTFKELR